MYKKLVVFTIFFPLSWLCYADRGNLLTYNSLDYIVSDEAFALQSLIDDLKNFLSSYYSVAVEKSEERIIKYDWKKFLYFENTFIVRKLDIYIKLRMNIQQQQPYLLPREKNNDYHIYFSFTRFVHENENTEDVISFTEDLDNKIELFTKKHNLKSQ